MKIILYTISTCQFSKQEKDYLTAHNLPFEEKNVEQNREFLTEMLTVGNNFAGTPLTKIEKDDGKIEVIKGFTKEEFDKVLGFEPVAQPATPPPAPAQQAPSPAPVATPAPVVAESAVQIPPPQNNPLESVLNDLQAKAAAPSTPVEAPASPVVPPPSASSQPTIPDPQF